VEKGWEHLDAAARIAQEVVQRDFHVLQKPYLLNVNIPNLPYEKIKGFAATRLGKRHQSEAVIKTQDPHGREIFWIGPAGKARDAGEGTDFHAVADNFVSITPLRIDLTHIEQLDNLRKGFA
jgi:5'-nucleotidase